MVLVQSHQRFINDGEEGVFLCALRVSKLPVDFRWRSPNPSKKITVTKPNRLINPLLAVLLATESLIAAMLERTLVFVTPAIVYAATIRVPQDLPGLKVDLNSDNRTPS